MTSKEKADSLEHANVLQPVRFWCQAIFHGHLLISWFILMAFLNHTVFVSPAPQSFRILLLHISHVYTTRFSSVVSSFHFRRQLACLKAYAFGLY